ncbi:MAG: glycoside hydrolase family 95 protein, partial [Verrucomicrobiota bacterium]
MTTTKKALPLAVWSLVLCLNLAQAEDASLGSRIPLPSAPVVVPAADLSLWYAQPAKDWMTEALPIGNSQMGAMLFGGVDAERIQFNEESLWLGNEEDTGAYQNFGEITVQLHGPGRTANYRRELDLNRALHRVVYEKDGVKFTRESFASFPAKVIVIRFAADKPGVVSGVVAMADAHAEEYSIVYGGKPVPATPADHRTETAVDPLGITISGRFPGYQYAGGKEWLPLNREAQLRVLHDGGTVSVHDGKVQVEKADSVTLLLAAGTDFKQDRSTNWRGALPHVAVTARLDAASKKSYAQLLAEHVQNYRRLFDRVSLSLGGADSPTLATDVRLKQYSRERPDLGLEELMFQYGRYLLISSSREGGLPANLQGKWNNSNKPAWRCDYHTDVNVEMNYWLADVANLSECFQPFATWIQSIREVRLEATKKAFGTGGWILRGECGLFGGSTWKWIPGTSAWLMQNSFDHYAFTRDKEYLRTFAYPAMKEVCEFWTDRLKKLPDGTLVAPNGFSPEHGPVEDGVSFDQQLVWDLFNNTIE